MLFSEKSFRATVEMWVAECLHTFISFVWVWSFVCIYILLLLKNCFIIFNILLKSYKLYSLYVLFEHFKDIFNIMIKKQFLISVTNRMYAQYSCTATPYFSCTTYECQVLKFICRHIFIVKSEVLLQTHTYRYCQVQEFACMFQ